MEGAVVKRRRTPWYQLPLQLSARTGTGESHLARGLWAALEAREHFPPDECPRLYRAYTEACSRIADKIIQAGVDPHAVVAPLGCRRST